jgi:hypothetical protein
MSIQRSASAIELYVFAIVVILLLCLLSAIHSEGQEIGHSTDATGGTISIVDSGIVTSNLRSDVYITLKRCIHGPWDFMIPNADGSWGEFTGDASASLCVWTNSPIHLAQIITGDVWIWADNGYVWPVVGPLRRNWWENPYILVNQ